MEHKAASYPFNLSASSILKKAGYVDAKGVTRSDTLNCQAGHDIAGSEAGARRGRRKPITGDLTVRCPHGSGQSRCSICQLGRVNGNKT